MRAMQKLDEAREKLEETNKEFDNARRKAKQAKMAFERYYIFQRYLSSI
jgi:structural maintenance of chromosome 1